MGSIRKNYRASLTIPHFQYRYPLDSSIPPRSYPQLVLSRIAKGVKIPRHFWLTFEFHGGFHGTGIFAGFAGTDFEGLWRRDVERGRREKIFGQHRVGVFASQAMSRNRKYCSQNLQAGAENETGSLQKEVRQTVAEHPDATLVELAEMLSPYVPVSDSTVCDFLKHLKITWKKNAPRSFANRSGEKWKTCGWSWANYATLFRPKNAKITSNTPDTTNWQLSRPTPDRL